MTERLLSGAAMLGEGPDPNWVDNFSKCILSQDYDTAREVLRGAISKGVSSHLAEQYAKVLEDFLQKRDEVENPIILAQHDQCIVRQTANKQGRGLFVPSYQTWGTQLWKQRPLACIQSGISRRCAQVCRACLLPVGTLASQLRYLGLDPPAGAEDILLTNGDLPSEEQPPSGFPPGQVVACMDGCDEVFCSEACRSWALSESSHALLCAARMEPQGFAALQSLEQLADEADQEHLLLLAHAVAQMILARQYDSTEQVKHRFGYQFASASWTSLADSESEAQARERWFAEALELLKAIFPNEEDFLEPKFLSGLLGTFELVNMCVSIPHPLNLYGPRLAESLSEELAACLVKLQEPLQELDSEEEEADESPDGAGAEAGAQALEAARAGQLFENVIGSALCEALAFINHSCLPNCRVEFASGSQFEANGPGLWLYCVSRRPLVPGDEVLMAYVPSVVGKPLEERQSKMKKFGFACNCRTCETDKVLEAEAKK